MNFPRLTRWALCIGTALTLVANLTAADSKPLAASAAATGAPLVFCADPDYMPYSNRSGEGFENQIATILGRALHRPVRYYWRSERAKDEYGEFITATIESKNCDVLVDVPFALQQVKTTRPYFISSYVFVYKKRRGYELSSLDSPVLRRVKVGYEGETPVQMGLKERTMLSGAKLFLTADQETQSPSAIVEAVEAGTIDVGLTWDPAIGYFVQKHPDLVAVTISNSRTQGYPEQFSFPMAMATREKDVALNAEIQRAIETHGSEIDAVLRRFNISFSVPAGDN